MDFVYYASGLLLLAVMVFIIIGLIHPALFKGALKGFATRPWIAFIGVLLFFTFSGTLVAAEPASVKQARFEREQRAAHARQIEQEQQAAARAAEEEARNRETAEEVVVTEPVAFSEQTTQDASLPKGQTRVAQSGQNGEKTLVYAVTYRGGQEIGRTLQSESVTKEPVPHITAVGIYEAPRAAAPSSGSGQGYTNSQGNYVPSPSSNPAGATAKCRDGTYSYSQSRRGTCSHHGGVAQWL